MTDNTQTPLERAARALAYGTGVEDDWPQWIPAARIVLLAIREPSEAMIKSGTDVPCDDFVSGGLIYSTDDEAKAIYQAMIDAALGE